MNGDVRPRTGGEILVAALRANGVDAIACVPGESYLAVLDALYDAPQIRVVVCRHEAAAANMADADGKLTGRPGVAFVTRGPGVTHASIGVHTAKQDSTPMILFVGQVARAMRGREAFQEIDVVRVFGGMAKWAVEIDDARRIPELVNRAFRTAMSGRPGPVVVSVPEDVSRERVVVADLGRAEATVAAPRAADVLRIRDEVARAARPLVIAGGGGWDAEASAALRRMAERADLPVGVSFRRQSLIDNRDPRYAGDVGIGINPALAKRVRDADLILALGPRLSEATTGGYTLLAAPRPTQRLVHVHADPGELGAVYEPDLALNASPAAVARELAELSWPAPAPWASWRRDARGDYEAALTPTLPGGELDIAAIVASLSATLPEDAILCNGAGNFAAWLHRFFAFKRYGTQLAPTSGAMGYGLPAAIAAKLRYPERVVVAWLGDGEFMMSAQELATAVQHRAAIVVCVIDNGMYGTIRMHQERDFPGREKATALQNPDFAALARAYGADGVRIERTEQFAPAFARARSAAVPTLLHLRVDPEQITPRMTISHIRDAAAGRGASHT